MAGICVSNAKRISRFFALNQSAQQQRYNEVWPQTVRLQVLCSNYAHVWPYWQMPHASCLPSWRKRNLLYIQHVITKFLLQLPMQSQQTSQKRFSHSPAKLTTCCWICSDCSYYCSSLLCLLSSLTLLALFMFVDLFVCWSLWTHLKISSSGKLPFSTTGGGSVVNSTISSPSAFLASFTRCLIYCLSWASPMNPYSFSNCNQHGCQHLAK